MVLAAVPVFLWGKRLMSPGYALLPAALVLLMPSLTYTGMLMTENAFFPAFVTACFAIAVTLERPTLLRQVLALGAIGVTCAVRPQALVLLVIYVAALALKLVLDYRNPDGPTGFGYLREQLVRFAPTGWPPCFWAVATSSTRRVRVWGSSPDLGPTPAWSGAGYDLSYAIGIGSSTISRS